jgi:hypothetical protein
MGFPYPAYLWTVVRRTALLWLLVRITYAILLMVGVLFFGLLPLPTAISLALHPILATRALLIAVTALLVWWDRRRAHELLLQANVGASPGWFWTTLLFTASMVDVTCQVLLEVA